MEADVVFMNILEKYPETHRFNLGSDTIQIWGGKRRSDQGQPGRGRASKTFNSNHGGSNNTANPNLRMLTTGKSSTAKDQTKGGTAPGMGAKGGVGEPSSNRIQKIQNQNGAPGGAMTSNGP